MQRARLFLVAMAVAVAACAGAPAPPPPGAEEIRVAVASSSATSPAVPPPAPAAVVVRARGAASRQPERARTLRALLASSGGRIGLPHTHQRVSLIVEAVVEGELADPDYARRPVGVNHLPVVLLDEAAFAAPDGLDGFAGTWRLTKLPDGTLVARAIADTPFARALGEERVKVLAATRKLLHAELPDDRISGLDVLGKHYLYELVPDVLPLLDDARAETRPPVVRDRDVIHLPRVVREVADARLRRMFAPLRDGELARDRTRGAWSDHWHDVTTRRPPALAPVVSGAAIELMRVTANQTWPEIVATGTGKFTIGVARLESPIDAHRTGVASVSTDGAPRTWLPGTPDAGFEPEGLTAASGTLPGVLYVGARDGWNLAPLGDPRVTSPVALAVLAGASHAALASDDGGFTVLWGKRDGGTLTVSRFDARGRVQGASRDVPLPGRPELEYHRGIRPLAIAPRAEGGWITAAETGAGISLTVLDAGFAVASSSTVAKGGRGSEPVIGARADHAVLAFRTAGEGEDDHLEVTTFDTRALERPTSRAIGSDVQKTSRVAVLPSGFAIAWIEADSEVHVAMWDALGAPRGRAVVHRGEVAPFSVALAEERGGLVVAFEDVSRYPYALVAKRVALDALR